jgi:hypothetical protein
VASPAAAIAAGCQPLSVRYKKPGHSRRRAGCAVAGFTSQTTLLSLLDFLGRARHSRWGGWLPLPALQRQGGAVTQHELGATTMEITTVGIEAGIDLFGERAAPASPSAEFVIGQAAPFGASSLQARFVPQVASTRTSR